MSSHDQPEADNRGQVPQTPTDPSQRAAHDDILHVLDEFSTGLQSLQHLYAQRQVLQDKLRATEAALAAREEAVRTREESLGAERTRLAEELASLSSARAELDRARADCEAKSAEVEHERAALAARREQSDADTRSRDQALATREQELAARESDSRESLRVIEAARAELDAEKAALDLARTSLETQLAEVAGLREDLSHERERLSKEADSLRELSEKNGHEAASFASLEGEAARLRDALAAGADLASDYASLWLVELARAESLRAQGEESVASLGELEGVLEQLKHRLREEHEAAEEAREAERRASEALAHAQRAHPVGNEGLEHLRRRLDLRQRRLAQGRVVLRAQADKIRRGGEALRKRFEQAEQVLAQRAELAGIRQRLIAENARIQRHKAGSRAGVITLCAVGVLGLLGGLSWALARQIAPATFRVESEIRADGRGRELSSAELEEWQRFHQELVNDPRFHEAAAEKFKRQGLLTLASPAAVGSMVSDSLAVDSDANGEMKLILRGQGSDATRRELETLTAALVAYANTAQQQRIDGGLTAVSKPATPDASPIDRTREFYALGILGGSTLLSLILAVTIWKRLSGAKSAFEQDSMLQAALAETTTWDVSKRG